MRHHVESHTVDFLKPQLPIKLRACLCGNQERLRMSCIRVLEADIHQLFPQALAVIFGECGEEIYHYGTHLGGVCGNAGQGGMMTAEIGKVETHNKFPLYQHICLHIALTDRRSFYRALRSLLLAEGRSNLSLLLLSLLQIGSVGSGIVTWRRFYCSFYLAMFPC
jgi:hypothetical protein